VLMLSNALSRVPDARPARQTWTYVDLAMVIGVGIGAIVFFYSGTFLNWSGVKGIYQAYKAWFATGEQGHGHEKPWYYWLKLIGRYEIPVGAGLLLFLFCQ
jgi:predicted membrane-bound mannosyltransferase